MLRNTCLVLVKTFAYIFKKKLNTFKIKYKLYMNLKYNIYFMKYIKLWKSSIENIFEKNLNIKNM